MWFSSRESFKEEMGHEIDGGWYPRVTKILDIKSKPALDNFFKEMGSFESAEEVKNKSAEEGSLVHEVAQKLLTGRDVEIPDGIASAMEALMRFNEERGMRF